MGGVTLTPLISAAELRRLLDAPERPIVLDVRWTLGASDPRAEHVARHIPGSVYVDMTTELAGRGDPAEGRHPLPEPHALAGSAARWGVGPESHVVVYDDNGGMSAARLWWLLRWIGHRAVQVLDGGLAAWVADGGAIASGEPSPVASGAGPGVAVGAMPTVSADDIVAGRAGLLLDARAAERYRGEVEPVDPVAGHIPGAVSAPTAGNLGADGRFLDPAALRQRFQSLGVPDDGPVTAYCGSGVTAAHEILALELAGWTAPALYAPSWSGWVTNPLHPVERS